MNGAPGDWTVLSMLEWGTGYFENRAIPDPRHSIESLLAEILGVKRLDLYLQFDRPLSGQELEQLRPLIKRRAGHEPLQYITGFTEFMNARIQVTPDVLIPRIETEQLVEIMLNDFPETGTKKRVLDIGTGSGCIPIALKMERPDWDITSIDISEGALAVARMNANENGVEVRFRREDLMDLKTEAPEPLYDIIVSNPPYVLPEEKEHLEKQVVEYEPPIALFCDDLSDMYGKIITYSEKMLSFEGLLYLELHELHAQEISLLFEPEKWSVKVLSDYEKKLRFIVAVKQY